jgi:hypothetical protein
VEHDQSIGCLAGEDFEQLPGMVGTEEEDPVFMGGIAIAFPIARRMSSSAS